ncbi:Helix-turn-helix domain protein [compost metagenome]
MARIAESLGYSDLANFAKFFKREAGGTPTEFRSRQTANQQGMAERLQAAGRGAEGDAITTRPSDPVPE